MIFRPFYDFDLGCASYLFGCGSLGRCAEADPRADDIESYFSFAEQKGMRITHVLDTHVHADHRQADSSWRGARARRTASTSRPTSSWRSRRCGMARRSRSGTRE